VPFSVIFCLIYDNLAKNTPAFAQITLLFKPFVLTFFETYNYRLQKLNWQATTLFWFAENAIFGTHNPFATPT